MDTALFLNGKKINVLFSEKRRSLQSALQCVIYAEIDTEKLQAWKLQLQKYYKV